MACCKKTPTQEYRKSRKHEAEIILGLGRPEPVPCGLRSVLWLGSLWHPFLFLLDSGMHRTCQAALVLLASLFQLGPTASSSWTSHRERTAGLHIVGFTSLSDCGWEAGCFRWDTSAPWSSRHGTRVPGSPDRQGNPRCAQIMHTHVDLTMDDGRRRSSAWCRGAP